MLSQPPARLEIAVRALQVDRQVVVFDHRARSIGELQRIGVEAGVHVADERPSRRDRLFDPDADVRLADAVGNQLKPRAVAVFGDQLRHALGIVGVQARGMRAVARARVDLTVDGDAQIGQRAVLGSRIEVIIEAGEAVRSRRRRRRGLLGGQVGRLSPAGKGKAGHSGQKKLAHNSHQNPHITARARSAPNSLASPQDPLADRRSGRTA